MTRLLVGRVSAARSKIMAAIKAKNSKAEVRLRKLLAALGLHYRLHRRDLPGSPDVVFVRQRLAVFCDGDFWHGRNWEERKRLKPIRTRSRYWINKIDSNIARDKRNNRDLRRLGWKVLRFWETDILKDGDKIAAKILKAYRQRSDL